jgi:predicted GTPase
MSAITEYNEIIKAVRALSREERLRLAADIAATLNDQSETEPTITTATSDPTLSFDDEVMRVSRQVMEKYDDLFRRLAEWPQDTLPKST